MTIEDALARLGACSYTLSSITDTDIQSLTQTKDEQIDVLLASEQLLIDAIHITHKLRNLVWHEVDTAQEQTAQKE